MIMTANHFGGHQEWESVVMREARNIRISSNWIKRCRFLDFFMQCFFHNIERILLPLQVGDELQKTKRTLVR